MLQHLIDIVNTASIFFVVSLGLLVILAVMGIVNFAQGAFITVGAYAAVVDSQLGWNPWLAIAMAPIAGFILGLLVERVVIRRLYHRPLDAILATWGVAIILVQLLSELFGRSAHFVNPPEQAPPVHLLDTYVPIYNLYILVIVLALGITLSIILRRTNIGNIAQAVIMNPKLAAILGINIRRVNALTFAVGSAITALAGATIVPMASANPNMGSAWLVTSFMVVLLAGSSLAGLATSAFVLAAAAVMATYFVSPVAGDMLIFLIPIVILRFAPDGILSLIHKRH